ncbi:MAG: DUF2177 family protein [Gammaproteobacteria bacterium]|jgi:uncharacterized membrane protein|nr:DUF2177 family protein [Gammaproteobacteria bacterium]
MKYLPTYLATLLALLVLDMLWLGLVAKHYYATALGHLLAPQPDIAVAMLFYCLFSLGLVLFVVVPHGPAPDWRGMLTWSALYGFFTYMTYDLTNLATLRDWPMGVAMLDISWGVVVSMAAATSGRLVMRRSSRS